MRFVLLRRYRGAAAGFRLGGDAWRHELVANTDGRRAGNSQAAAALSTMTNRDGCMSGCVSRGHPKDQCVNAVPPRPLTRSKAARRLCGKGRGGRR